MGKKGNSSKTVEAQVWQWTENVESSNITEHEIRTAYRLHLPPCNNCRKNCGGNPRCLYGLGETYWLNCSSNASADEEKLLKVEKEIDSERRKPGELVGLRNLGATCYVNTYLQLWYHNIDFRNALYALKEDAEIILKNSPQTLCGQLQLIFGLLQNSSSKCVDPSSFIESLGLATDLQQDAQEFSKLFMSLLEMTPALSEVIQMQFSGEYAYATKCLNCQSKTETPAKFYELDLNIQGHKDLRSCMLEFLQQEQLQGDNQYFCDTCSSKQDAVRQIKLRKLPQTLSIQLLRFVYDRATQRRHKISTNLSFPDKLDFSSIVEPSALAGIQATELEYYLSAVLIHRGPSASSGHFVAHILDYESGNWYKFNDEVVVKMKSGRKLNLDNCKGEDDVWNEVQLEPAAKRPKIAKGNHSSKDVYMLVYSRTSPDKKGENLSVPEHIQSLVDERNLQFETGLMDTYITAQEEQTEKHKLVKNMNEFMNILHSKSGTCEWIPTAHLRNYFNSNKPNPTIVHDNFNLLCLHSKLRLDKIGAIKHIRKAAVDIVYANHEEALRLTDDMMCKHCVENHCMLLQGKHKLAMDFTFVSENVKAFDATTHSSTECFYVGRHSLRKWRPAALRNIVRKYQAKVAKSETDASASKDEETDVISDKSEDEDQFCLNSDILCDHGNLSTDLNDLVIVPDSVWKVLRYYFPDTDEFKLGECAPCPLCVAEVDRQEQELHLRKMMAQEQKAALSQLYANKNRPIHPTLIDPMKNATYLHEQFYVVSMDFIARWREFVRHPDRNEIVTKVDNEVFLCPHGKLLYDLTAESCHIQCEEGHSGIPGCVFLWEDEWNFIKTHFIVDQAICLQKNLIPVCSVRLEKMKEHVLTMDKLRKSENGHDVAMDTSNETNNLSVLIQSDDNLPPKVNHNSTQRPSAIVVCLPEMCSECMTSLALEEQKRLCVYDDAEIYVMKSTKTLAEMRKQSWSSTTHTEHAINNGDTLGGVRRTSRARRSAYGEKKLRNISSGLTLKELKVKIMGLFSVPPFDQNLWLNGGMLTDDTSTLGKLSITPGCTITLVEDLPNPDNAPIIYETTKSNEPELGFKGTGLLGYTN